MAAQPSRREKYRAYVEKLNDEERRWWHSCQQLTAIRVLGGGALGCVASMTFARAVRTNASKRFQIAFFALSSVTGAVCGFLSGFRTCSRRLMTLDDSPLKETYKNTLERLTTNDVTVPYSTNPIIAPQNNRNQMSGTSEERLDERPSERLDDRFDDRSSRQSS